jgi:4,5-dihydroxyphthalate decarboxylase
MSNIRLSLGCGDYDRTRALRDGSVRPEGIDLSFVTVSQPSELFWRMMRGGEFDMSEMSLSNYLTERSREDYRFIAIPVYPSRKFRHSFIFINKKSGIALPEDLKHKRIGTPLYGKTAIVWLRGMLQDEYGIAPSDVEWHVGAWEEIGKEEKVEFEVPEDVHLHFTPEEKTLNDMLASGEIDALVTTTTPRCFHRKHPDVDRLWPNYKEVEMAYYRKTRIFPIMHTVVIKREVYEAHPWVTRSMYEAFCRAKKLGQEALASHSALAHMLPWTMAEYEATVSLMGEDFFPYGVEAGRTALEPFTRYSYEQGLSSRKLSVEELFAPNTIPKPLLP